MIGKSGIEKIIFVDPKRDVAEAFRDHFSKADYAEVVNDRFETLAHHDCMVSAANSFGLMDGGVDGAITRFFGEGLMEAVQRRIVDEFMGEQPVGTCIIVETGHPKHPYLAHTPTMRVPRDIRGTDNVYNAMLAMLRAVSDHNAIDGRHPIRVVACPGLGTLTGRVPAKEAARQMLAAVDAVRFPITEISWPVAMARAIRVLPGR